MKIGVEFEKIVKEKYLEMKSNGISEDFLDQKLFGYVKIYINPKEKISMRLHVLQYEDDTVIVGA